MDQKLKKTKFKALLPLTVMVLFFSNIAESAFENSLVLCKNKKQVRTLRVEIEDKVCRTIYTKQGVDSIIGSGQSVSSCGSIVDNVRQNLETAHWDCREVQEAKLSNISEL